MTAEVFGVGGLLILLSLVGGLVLVIYSVVQAVRSPGLTTGAKWLWSLGMLVGYWFFWLPGFILAVVFL